jgi:antirestriction protein ArdC
MRVFGSLGLEHRFGRTSLIKALVAISLGAVIVCAPLAAMAQTAHAGGGGSYNKHMRHSRNASRERARAGAEHARAARHHHHAPVAPKS